MAAGCRFQRPLVGPFDLAVSLGHGGDWRHAEVQAGMSRMLDAAARAEVPVIVPVFDSDIAAGREQVLSWKARGVQAFTLGTDKILLADAALRWTSAGRSSPS